MLFASIELASRIERAECDLLRACAAAVAARRPDVDVFVEPLAGGLAACGSPGSPLNKLAGLGFDGAIDEGELTRIEGAFSERGVPLQVEVSNLADPSVVAHLTRRDYVLQNFENVLGRPLPLGDLPHEAPGIGIAHAKETEFDAWVETVVTGFATPDDQGVASHETFPRDVLTEAVRDLASGEGFLRYLARRDGQVAGGASMRLSQGVAQLCGAATLPEHRRRGVQTALLEARLTEASEAGCDISTVTTQPGSKSHENVQRQGFELLYTRAILVREP